GNIKSDCSRKKSNKSVTKDKYYDDEGKAYYGKALDVRGNVEMAELMMDLGGSCHM
ncbi:hypothetical protein Tco_0757000, partial [Tanacetum coccineum]